jgi:DNA repair exonuclease SbcCD nuclease subunit
MKILMTADIHYGIPGKLQHSDWAMRVIREYAVNNSINTIFVLGDLFNDRNNISVDTLSVAYQFFEDSVFKYNQEWVVFPGNHDLYLKNSWSVNSVKCLSRVSTIIPDVKALIIDSKRFWVLPFIHYESAYMEVVRAIDAKATCDDILLTHIGINNAVLNECFMLKNWSVVSFNDTKFKKIFTGHFHCHQSVGNVMYPGSPIPFRFDEGLVEHGFLEYDITTDTTKFINIYDTARMYNMSGFAPDYKTCIDKDVFNVETANSNVRVYLSRQYSSNELKEFRSKIINNGALSVKWAKLPILEKEEIQNIAYKSNKDDLFKRWLLHDKPEFDNNALTQINESVVSSVSDIEIENA